MSMRRLHLLAEHTNGGGALDLTTIGGKGTALHPELVPLGYDTPLMRTRWAFDVVRWMVQKHALGQDMYLLGTFSPVRRWLAFRFCEVIGCEMEYVALTADTSESDLKQRREIVRDVARGGGGTVVWTDQPVVRAAVEGRVLVLDCLLYTSPSPRDRG